MNSIIRTINGKALPAEAEVTHDVMTIDKNSGNNLSGNMKRTILGEKDKITIVFPPMSAAAAHSLLQQFQSSSMTVVHTDFWNQNKITTQEMYHGDMSKTVMSYVINGGIMDSVKIELISYNVRKINY